MKTFLVTLKPLEPYFFGNEKNFVYPKAKDETEKANNSQLSNSYFIKSEYMPSQSTVLGALRYVLLPVKKSNWDYTEAEKKMNSETIGKNSFNPNQNNDFGKIKSVSPVFLYDGVTALIPTPFDHICDRKKYTPFSKYSEVKTPDSTYLCAEEYNSKNGVTSDYMQLSDGAIISFDSLFTSVTRMGINRRVNEKGLFKKTYRQLNNKYAFAVYLDLDDDLAPENTVVYLGQGKSTFALSFEEKENNIENEIKQYLRDDVVYFLGDAFVFDTVYKNCKFAVTKTKTYRAFQRVRNKVSKDTVLYNLISAGSVVIPHNKAEFVDFVNNEKVDLIGYNKIVTK